MRAFVISFAAVLGTTGCVASLTPAQIAEMEKARATMRADYPPMAKEWVKDTDTCRKNIGGADWKTTMKECLEVADAKLMAALKAEAASQTEPVARDAITRTVACVDAAKKEIMPGVPERYEVYVRPCFDERKKGLAAGAASTDSTFAKLEKEDSAEAWLGFIESNKDDKRVVTAAKRVATLAVKVTDPDRAKWEERLVLAYPASFAELPVERRILLVGPKGARVRDLLKMKEAKVANSIILARIKAASEPYKSFDGDELIALKGLGFGDDDVAAMIEVTTKLEDRRRESDERQAMRAEIAALKKMIEDKKATGGAGGGSGEIVQTKDGPMDVLASCGKRLGAIKLCEQLPFPASTVCSSTAESSFPCPKH